MATTTWQSSSSGDWNVAGNWSAGVPGTTDVADIASTFAGAAYTVSLTADETAQTVLLAAANATLSVPFRDVLDAATMDLGGGGVDLGGTIDGDIVQASGGTLDFAGMLEVDTFEADGVTLDANGGIIGGPGATQWDGALVLGGNSENLTIENGLLLRDTGGTQNGEIDFTGDLDELQFVDSTTLDGTGLGGNPNLLIHFDSAGAVFNQLRVATGVVLTLGANVSVLADAANSKAGLTSVGSIVNDGTITAIGPSVTFDLEPEVFSNAGTVIYSNGAGGNFQSQSFANTGSIAISGGGTVTAVFGIDNDGSIDVSGASTLLLQDAATGSGAILLSQGGTVWDDHGLTGSVIFLDATDVLGIQFASSQQPTETIEGFSGFGGPATHDAIELADYTATTIEPYGGDATGGNLVLNSTDGSGTADLHLLGNYVGSSFAFQIVNGDTTEITIACFAAGTRILTACGDVAVEALVVGDLVPTLRSGLRPVQWIGHRRVDCRRHPEPRKAWPVRVHADAFGVGRPQCDLWLSPDHAVWLGDGLIPIRYLVNGASIVQEPVDEVTYWHVELARHEVILAAGLPCESYLDTDNRGAFANGGPSERAGMKARASGGKGPGGPLDPMTARG